jgi:hypothetical protein
MMYLHKQKAPWKAYSPQRTVPGVTAAGFHGANDGFYVIENKKDHNGDPSGCGL